MTPPATTRLLIADEMPAVTAWAGRHSARLEWCPDQLELRVVITQPSDTADDGETFYLRGRFDGYRTVAPEWLFTANDWFTSNRRDLFPKPQRPPFAGASIFIEYGGHGVICAHFNRLAYTFDDNGSKRAGPHTEWGPPTNWLETGKGYVRAYYIGEMLQVINQHLSYTRGRLG